MWCQVSAQGVITEVDEYYAIIISRVGPLQLSSTTELVLWLNLEVVMGTRGGCNLCTSEGPGAELGCQFT